MLKQALRRGAGDTDEVQLRKRIAELQEYRKAGLTSFSEIEKYEKDKVTHVSRLLQLFFFQTGQPLNGWAVHSNRQRHFKRMGQIPESCHGESWSQTSTKYVFFFFFDAFVLARFVDENAFAAGGLSLANSTSLSLLTPAEQLFCSRNRMLPRPFLFIKQTLLREVAMRQEELSQSDAAALFPTDSAEAIWAVWKLLFDPSEEKQLEEEAEEQKPVVTSALPAALSTVNGDERDGSATPAAAPLPSAINVDSPSVLSSLSQPAPVVQVNGSLTG